jgi:hypothetical protein
MLRDKSSAAASAQRNPAPKTTVLIDFSVVFNSSADIENFNSQPLAGLQF